MSSPETRKPGPVPTPYDGRRVQLHPATDRWMAGDRYGTITGGVRHRPGVYFVHLDRSDTTARLHSDNLIFLEGSINDPAGI